jgi:hypothetical protein
VKAEERRVKSMRPKGGNDGCLRVRDTAQENVMNAHEETHLFLVVVNKPKKFNSNQH